MMILEERQRQELSRLMNVSTASRSSRSSRGSGESRHHPYAGRMPQRRSMLLEAARRGMPGFGGALFPFPFNNHVGPNFHDPFGVLFDNAVN